MGQENYKLHLFFGFLLFTLFFSYLYVNSNKLMEISNVQTIYNDENDINNDILAPKASFYDEFFITAGGSLNDLGYRIAVDSQGYIYVVGHNETKPGASNEFKDMILLKYNNSGDLEWSWEYNGADDHPDYARDVAVDNNGNVFVVGEVQERSGLTDLKVVKLNSSGDVNWSRSWYPAGSWAKGFGVKIDAQGNVYAIGYCYQSSLQRMVVVKYNSTGDEQWNATYVSGSTETRGVDICIASNGDVYAMGNVGGSSSNITLVKYNNSGDFKWSVEFDKDTYDWGNGMDIDTNDNLYIAGQLGSGPSGMLLIKYNKDGTHLWNKTYYQDANMPTANDIEFDDINNEIYLIGSNSSTPNSVCVLKTNESGDEIWLKNYNYAGNNTRGLGIALDANLNIYSTGFVWTGTNDIFAAKFNLLPGTFTLNSTAEVLDPDGNFRLYWTSSSDAKNYSVYHSTQSFSKVTTPGVTEIANNIITPLYIDRSEVSGNHYYAVVAFNDLGNTTSNIFLVQVGIPPGSFSLSTDASNPDPDGSHTLTWTSSLYANNYTIYYSLVPITDVDDVNIESIYAGSSTEHTISSLEDGTYYYIVMACNNYGNYTTNAVAVTVKLDEPMPWWLRAVITGAISASAGLVIKIAYSSRKRRKELYDKIGESMTKIDNIEKFLETKLGYDEYNKLKDPLLKYKEREISHREFVKAGKKSVGDKFVEIFAIAPPKKKKKSKTKEVEQITKVKAKKLPPSSAPDKDVKPDVMVKAPEVGDQLKNIQRLIDELDINLKLGEITQEEYARKIEILNSKKNNLLGELKG